MLWGLGSPTVQEAVLAAHHATVGRVLALIEERALPTRTGHAGAVQLTTRGAVAAAFDHLEQLSWTAESDHVGEHLQATVATVRFHGPEATVTFTIGAQQLDARGPSMNLPAPGDRVRLTVTGTVTALRQKNHRQIVTSGADLPPDGRAAMTAGRTNPRRP